MAAVRVIMCVCVCCVCRGSEGTASGSSGPAQPNPPTKRRFTETVSEGFTACQDETETVCGKQSVTK